MPVRRVYLDSVASAPLDPTARLAIEETLGGPPGNPSSPHLEGRAARDALEEARTRVATVLGARPREVVFTSGATEALQIAVRGAAHARSTVSRRVVLSAAEHPAVSEAADVLAKEGFEVVRVPVSPTGEVDAGRFLAAAAGGAAVAALILASHESGAVQPVREVAEGLRPAGIPLVCDAALGPGRVPTLPDELGVSLLALSGHKFGAPPGIGVLFVRRKTPITRVLAGGIQEERLRPGTENVASARALAAALEPAVTQRESRATRYAALESRFLAGLGAVAGWRRLGPARGGLPGLVTIETPGVEGEALMINLDLEGIAVATGSTCALGSADPSPGLLAMGLTPQRAASTVRVSFGEGLSEEDVDRAVEVAVRVLDRLRALAHPGPAKSDSRPESSRPAGA